jgi:hypothetical protein
MTTFTELISVRKNFFDLEKRGRPFGSRRPREDSGSEEEDQGTICTLITYVNHIRLCCLNVKSAFDFISQREFPGRVGWCLCPA